MSMQGGQSCPHTDNNEYININNNTLSNKETGRFKKPSIEEIRSYCLEKSSRVDPEQFFNFYESNGWMVGKNHMKDWKAACRTWENMRKSENKKEEKERWKQRKEEAKAQFAKQLESQNDSKKLYKLRDNLLQEIKTAENNILFFTAKSKNANKLVDDMQRKINELKEQLAEIKEK